MSITKHINIYMSSINRLTAITGCIFWLAISGSMAKDYVITDFGATTDSENNAKSIQEAINTAFAAGGGRVIIPQGAFTTGTVIMKNFVALHLERGAKLLGSTNQKDYPRQPIATYRSQKDGAGWFAVIFAEGAHDIAITGQGTIDGQGAQQKPRPDAFRGDRDGRPRNILFISCKNITVSGILMRNAGIWNQHYLNCEHVLVNHVRVLNHSNRNNDGIDIDGCRDFILTNSIIDSDDDAICLKSTGLAPCENIIISNCVASTYCNGIKMGTESTGGFKNINISNCIVKPTTFSGHPTGNKSKIGITGISLEIVDGGHMSGVSVNNITIEGTNCPLYVRLGARNRKHTQEVDWPTTGTMENITISNITAYGSGNFACSITGIPGHRIKNIRLNNINIIQQGGVKEGDYLKNLADVKESERGYPQPTVWGNLPVCGLFMRHVDDITVTNFSIDALQLDPRPVFMAHDINDLKIQGLSKGHNIACEKEIVLEDVKNKTILF